MECVQRELLSANLWLLYVDHMILLLERHRDKQEIKQWQQLS